MKDAAFFQDPSVIEYLKEYDLSQENFLDIEGKIEAQIDNLEKDIELKMKFNNSLQQFNAEVS